MAINKLVLVNQFGEESINAVEGSVLPLPGSARVCLLTAAGAPTNGGSGTGANVAGKGSVYIDSSAGNAYTNTGTLSSPTWTVFEAGNASVIAALLTGFTPGAGSVTASDSILGALQKLVGNATALQTAAETVSAAGAISTTNPESILSNGTGSTYAATLAAPSSQDGQLKILKMGTNTHTVTVAMTNIATSGAYTASGTTTLTFTNTGDSAVLMAVGAKWVYLGGSAVAS